MRATHHSLVLAALAIGAVSFGGEYKSIVRELAEDLRTQRLQRCEQAIQGKIPELESAWGRVFFRVLTRPDSLARFSRPDRIVLRLAEGLDDPAMTLLTPAANVALPEALDGMRVGDIVREHTHTPTLTEDRAIDFLVKSGHEWLRRMRELENAVSEVKMPEGMDAGAAKKAYDEAVHQAYTRALEHYEQAPPKIQILTVARQRYAFVLNRRNFRPEGELSDQDRAIEILEDLVNDCRFIKDEFGENCGLLARIYRDRYYEARERGDTEAMSANIELAIETYVKGFESDLGNYYPALPAINLLIEKGDPKSMERATYLASVALLSLKRVEETPQASDMWELMSFLTLKVLAREWESVQKVLPFTLEAFNLAEDLKSSIETLETISANWQKSPADCTDFDYGEIRATIAAIQDRRDELRGRKPKRKLFDSEEFARQTEGTVAHLPADINTELERSEIRREARLLEAYGAQLMTIHDLLVTFDRRTRPNGYLLGATGPYLAQILAIGHVTGLSPWGTAFADMGVPLGVEHTEDFMLRMVHSGQPIVFLVPPNFRTRHRGSATWREFQWMHQSPKERAGNVKLVFGAHDLLDMTFEDEVRQDRSKEEHRAYIRFLMQRLQNYLHNRNEALGW